MPHGRGGPPGCQVLKLNAKNVLGLEVDVPKEVAINRPPGNATFWLNPKSPSSGISDPAKTIPGGALMPPRDILGDVVMTDTTPSTSCMSMESAHAAVASSAKLRS